jgi:hypothetical protein
MSYMSMWIFCFFGGDPLSCTLGHIVSPFFFSPNNQLIPTEDNNMQKQPYTNVSGMAENSNKINGFVNINAKQYTAHYKTAVNLSVL